jgi:hypothetical protein
MLPLSFRVKAGVAHLPMSSWKSFTGITNFPTDKYTTETPTVISGVTIYWKLSEKHSISLGSEVLKPKISWVGVLPLINEASDTVGFSPLRLDWAFRTIPLTIGYEYKTGIWKDGFEPVIGLGASLMFSEVKVKYVSISNVYTIHNSSEKRTGEGYGIDGSLGFHNKISKHLSSIWQVRYRYSDGMYFSDEPGDTNVEFTGFDFSIGLEFKL